MSQGEFHIFVKAGDARPDVERAARELGLSLERAGVHRHMYVTRANQTVVMAESPTAPIAPVLRERGWSEPGDAS